MKAENILIFSFSHIGDTVLSTAVIPPLQENFPDAKISVLVGPKARGILQGDPRISEIITYDNKGHHSGFGGKIALVKGLRKKKFDLVVDLRDSGWSHLIGSKRWGAPLMQRRKTDYRESHAVDRYLRILSAHGIDKPDSAPELPILPHEKEKARNFLLCNRINEDDIIVGIHPGGGWRYKLWAVDRFAGLGDILSQKYGAKILVFAGSDEVELQDRVCEMMKFPPVAVKDINLRELSALIEACDLYIGNDTGPMHIASAVKTRVIAIFGSTSAVRSAPYGNEHIVISEKIECSPCHPGRHPGKCNRGSCQAMEAIPLELVVEYAERILNEKKEGHISSRSQQS